MKVLRDQSSPWGYPWPAEPTGTIGVMWVDGVYRETMTVDGPTRSYWVTFDEPQWDADGDGPYGTAEVLECYLVRI